MQQLSVSLWRRGLDFQENILSQNNFIIETNYSNNFTEICRSVGFSFLVVLARMEDDMKIVGSRANTEA